MIGERYSRTLISVTAKFSFGYKDQQIYSFFGFLINCGDLLNFYLFKIL